jgi:DNA repair protein RecO
MGRTQKCHSIVLRTHDVGEADRFCILLTKERGKIAARARGVRKPKSRMGGSLLALQETAVDIQEGSSGLNINSASCILDFSYELTLPNFLQAEQAMELLLSLLEDDHPIPDIFLLTQDFLYGCRQERQTYVLPFTIRLLQQLGVLPQDESHQIFCHLSDDERTFICECSRERWWETALPPQDMDEQLSILCNNIIGEQTSRTMRAKPVSQAILEDS